MVASPPDKRSDFLRDLRTAQATARQSISASRASAQDRIWTSTWQPFCRSLHLDPLLSSLPDKVPILQVFATRVRDGRCSRSGQPVKADTVADDILAVAKTFVALGTQDPRLNAFGIIDQRLANQIKGMRNIDPPPDRVPPAPIQLLHNAQTVTDNTLDPSNNLLMDLIWTAFFYLLRPGEYCHTADNSPLCGANITLSINNQRLNIFSCPTDDLFRATSSAITFDTQKNRQRGEVIAHGLSGHAIACPTRALARIVLNMRQHNISPDQPICTAPSRHAGLTFPISSTMITKLLRTTATAHPISGISPPRLQARSLRSGGAMALLCGRVDSDHIKLVGRWRSDAMFRYLHAQTLPIIRRLAATMVEHGAFTLAPGATTPASVDALLDSVPLDTQQHSL